MKKTQGLALAIILAACAVPAATLPPNVALSARATATSEYSDQYRAQFAVDGKIPSAGLRDDAGSAWCVRGDTHRNGAEILFAWAQSQPVGELVYYGRTAWMQNENWR